MAQYDFISVSWANNTCNIPPFYYAGGFSNKMYFSEDLSEVLPEIEADVKKTKGANKAKKQTLYYRYALEVICNQYVAMILAAIPMHEVVTIIDKDGNRYDTTGPDIEIDCKKVGMELIDSVYYPIMQVTLTFNAEVINKTACCDTSVAAVECSDVVPVIDNIDETIPGTMVVTGTAPDNMLVRINKREFLESIKVGNSIKINDVCFVSATVAYCCSNLGGVYKTINGGATWTYKGGSGGVQLNGIAFDGVDKIYVVGDITGGHAISMVLTVGTDLLTPINTGLNENLKAVSFGTSNGGYACGANGSVLFFNGAVWSNVTPGTITLCRDVHTLPGTAGVAIVVGLNYICYTSNSGAAWTITNHAGNDFNACCMADAGDSTIFYAGNTNGDIVWTDDRGATISIEKAGSGTAIHGLSSAMVNGQMVIFALYANGNVLKDNYHSTTWNTTYKIKGAPVSNRIRTFSGVDMQLLVAEGNEYCATTETSYAIAGSTTADEFTASGITYTGTNNTTYQLYPQTYLLNSDPCETGLISIFTT